MKAIFAHTLLCSLTTVHAAVIQNDAMILDAFDPAFFLHQPAFTVTSAAHLVVEVTSGSGNNFTFQYAGIAWPYSLFRVSLGTSFDASFANSQPVFVSNNNNPGTGVLNLRLGQSTYLAYLSQRQPGPAIESNLYGWAKLTNSQGKLIVESSATADRGGIIVGTLQQIPEPTAVTLFAASLVFCCMQRGRRKSLLILPVSSHLDK
jgi:hypothetical protein